MYEEKRRTHAGTHTRKPDGGFLKEQGAQMKKWMKGRRGNNQKHSTVNLNGKTYNGMENTHICSNLSQAAPKKVRKEIEQENSADADSGCIVNFVAVSDYLDDV